MPLEKQEEYASERVWRYISEWILGRFTHFSAYDAGTRRIGYSKAFTTYARPLDGITAQVDKVGIDLGEAALFRHSTFQSGATTFALAAFDRMARYPALFAPFAASICGTTIG
jgi:hypothetical protein